MEQLHLFVGSYAGQFFHCDRGNRLALDFWTHGVLPKVTLAGVPQCPAARSSPACLWLSAGCRCITQVCCLGRSGRLLCWHCCFTYKVRQMLFLVFHMLLFHAASSNRETVSGSRPGLCCSCRLALLSLLQSVCTRQLLGLLGYEKYWITPPCHRFEGVELPGH